MEQDGGSAGFGTGAALENPSTDGVGHATSVASEGTGLPPRTQAGGWRLLPDDPVVVWVRTKALASVTFLGFVLVVLEVLAAARYRPEVALALVQAADPVKVVLGVAVTAGPVLMPPAVLLCWAWSREFRRRAGSSPAGLMNLMLVLGVVALYASSMLLVLIYVAAFVLYDPLPRFILRRWGKRARWFMEGEQFAYFSLWLLISAVITVVEVPAPWMAEEVVRVSAEPAIAAYVVNDTGQTATLLMAQDRTIVYVPSDQIVSRVVCRNAEPWIDGSLGTLIAPTSSPVCP